MLSFDGPRGEIITKSYLETPQVSQNKIDSPRTSVVHLVISWRKDEEDYERYSELFGFCRG